MERIETRRLILRPFCDSDGEDVFDYAKDPRVGPIAGWPAHRDEAESLEIIRTVFATGRVAAVVLKESGKVLGSVGFVDVFRDTLPQPDNEIGYALHPDYWGRGLMPEAVRAVMEYGFEKMGLRTIWCGYYEGNEKSKRVVEKCGFLYRFTSRGKVPLMGETRTEYHYALTKEEWQRA